MRTSSSPPGPGSSWPRWRGRWRRPGARRWWSPPTCLTSTRPRAWPPPRSSAFGRLDIVVNNVGGALPRPFTATTARHLAKAFEFNVAVAHSLTQAAVPHLLAAGSGDGPAGAVINISSAVGRVAGRGYLAYGTAKAALAHYTRLAAADLAPRIRVNAVAVGAAATSALDIVLVDDSLRRQMERATPLGRIGDPQEVAAAIVFLASPASAYLTGKILEVDGGIDRPNLDLGIPDL